MALCSGVASQLLCRLHGGEPRTAVAPRSSVRFPCDFHRRSLVCRSLLTPAVSESGSIAPAISLTDKALNHLYKIRSERKEDLCLRIGVRQGGCSGMSYTMEFENRANARPDDSTIENTMVL